MKHAHRLREITTATSMATIALGGAVVGGQSLAQVMSKGAAKNDPNRIQVGDVIPITIESQSSAQWEEGLYTVTSPTVLTRLQLLDSSNADGSAITNWTGTRNVFCTPSAEWLSKVISSDDGIAAASLTAASSANSSTKLLGLDSNNGIITVAAGLLPAGSGSGTADTTAPSVPGSLATSGTTQTQTTLSWAASTDNSGVAPSYEVSRNGTTWTAVAAGTLNYTFTGLTAATLYTLQTRSVDGSGNKSAAASVQVTTSAASGDTTAPNMAGSLTTASVTATGYTMNWPAGTDNVAVTGYETSTDGGTTWLDVGNVLTRAVTGATASTTYNLRVRAYDAAGNRSNVLSAPVTTSASGPTMAQTYNNLAFASFTTPSNPYSFSGGTAANQYFSQDFKVQVKASDGSYPAANALKFIWIRVPSGAAAPTSLPSGFAWSGSAWPTAVPYSGNGGTAGGGNVPNSVATSGYFNEPSYPGIFNGMGSLFGGGAAGDYYSGVLFPDGSFGIVPTKVVVQ